MLNSFFGSHVPELPVDKRTTHLLLFGLNQGCNLHMSYIYIYTPNLKRCFFLKIWVFQKKRYPQIIHFNRDFRYKPSIFGYHYIWKHPYSSFPCWYSRFLCANNYSGASRLPSQMSPRSPRRTRVTPYEEMISGGILRREPLNEVAIFLGPPKKLGSAAN